MASKDSISEEAVNKSFMVFPLRTGMISADEDRKFSNTVTFSYVKSRKIYLIKQVI